MCWQADLEPSNEEELIKAIICNQLLFAPRKGLRAQNFMEASTAIKILGDGGELERKKEVN